MMAAVNPAIIIPMIINAEVEFSRFEKKTMSSKAKKLPIKDTMAISHELLAQADKPKMVDRKITIATPKPEADVIPKTDGSANGFRNNSCNKNPLMGKEIPAKTAAKVLGSRKSMMSFRATSLCDQSIKLASAFP